MSGQPRDEETLILRAKASDQEALTQLYEENVQTIYRYIYYRMGDSVVAEDLTADTFLRAYQALPDFEYRGSPFKAFLYRIAQARIADHYRKSGRRKTVPLDSVIVRSDSDPEAELGLQLRVEHVQGLLAKLTEAQQQVIILRFLQGHSIAEVAEVLNKSAGAVKALQFRGLRRLAQLIEAQQE